MAEKIIMPPISDERQIIAIVQSLPPERKAQVLAFARFLAFETYQTKDLDFVEGQAGFDDVNTESDARWDALLATEEGQLALEKLADEALADIRAGKARSMAITENGELAPE